MKTSKKKYIRSPCLTHENYRHKPKYIKLIQVFKAALYVGNAFFLII